MSQNLNSAVAVIGIDIGKNSFHLVGLDDRGAIVLRQKWSRGQADRRRESDQECRPRIVRGKGRRKGRRERGDGAVHEAGEPRLHILQHEHAPCGLVLGGAWRACGLTRQASQSGVRSNITGSGYAQASVAERPVVLPP
jgi:hypothetical protein